MNTHSKPTVADISGSLKVPYMAWMEHSEWPYLHDLYRPYV